MQVIDDFLSLGWKIDQIAPLYRLHNKDWLAMLAADLVALAAFNSWVLVVYVIELYLNYLYLWVFSENLIQDISLVVEGHTYMLYLSLFLQGEGCLVSIILLEVLEYFSVLGMHKIIIKIFHATVF